MQLFQDVASSLVICLALFKLLDLFVFFFFYFKLYLPFFPPAGAYLVPYLILLVLIGIPLFFLELAVGQRIRRGSIGVWNYISPRLGGIGFASCVVSLASGFGRGGSGLGPEPPRVN